METIRLRVPDMSCGHCVAAVRSALERVKGVESVEVSLETKLAVVTASPGLDPSALTGAVREAGYFPEPAG